MTPTLIRFWIAPRHLHRRRREGKLAAFLLHQIQNLQIQRVFYLHEIPQIDFGDVHPARQINAVIVELIQRNRHAVGLHVGLGLQHGGQIGGQLFDFFARGIVGQTNRKLPQAALAAVIVLDVLRCDF